MTSAKVKWMLGAARPIKRGDLADQYLRSRGLRLKRFPDDLRQDDNGNMVAFIRNADGEVVSYQRTFLHDWPRSKERKMAGGCKLPNGSAIRLYPASRTLGVAESTENALTCSALFGVNTWSLMSAGQMEKWLPPYGVKQVLIFPDNDKNHVGQKSSGVLAKRLDDIGVAYRIHLPCLENFRAYRHESMDWNDFLLEDTQCLSR